MLFLIISRIATLIKKVFFIDFIIKSFVVKLSGSGDYLIRDTSPKNSTFKKISGILKSSPKVMVWS